MLFIYIFTENIKDMTDQWILNIHALNTTWLFIEHPTPPTKVDSGRFTHKHRSCKHTHTIHYHLNHNSLVHSLTLSQTPNTHCLSEYQKVWNFPEEYLCKQNYYDYYSSWSVWNVKLFTCPELPKHFSTQFIRRALDSVFTEICIHKILAEFFSSI